MNRKQDLRVIRTQKYLRRALIELMGEKSVQKITVKELTERAEVSRGTFYLYYDSVEGMADSLYADLHSSLIENAKHVLEKNMDFRTSCLEFIKSPFTEDEDILAFRNCCLQGLVDQRLVLKAISAVKNEFAKAFTIDADEGEMEYLLEFLSGGISSIILNWALNESNKKPFQEIADIIIGIIYNSHKNLFGIKRR